MLETLRRSCNRLTLLLVLGVVALSAALGAALRPDTDPRPAMPASAPAGPGAQDTRALPDTSFSMPPLRAFSETVQRPLFVEGRRPAEDSGQSEPQRRVNGSRGPRERLVLSAIVVQGGQRFALLHRISRNEFIRLHEGDRLGEWSVERIEPHKIELKGKAGGREMMLREFQDKEPIDVALDD